MYKNIMNKKDAFLPRTPLDYLIEAVEAEFGSVENAPDYAMKPVWDYVKRHHMGVYDHHSTQHKRTHKRKNDARGGIMIPTKVWKSNNQWYSNNKRVVKAICILRQDPEFGLFKACRKAHCSTGFISNTPIAHLYFKYQLKSKEIKAYSKTQLVGKCKKDGFPFAPTSLADLEHHNYLGIVKEFHYYDNIYYSKTVPKGTDNHE